MNSSATAYQESFTNNLKLISTLSSSKKACSRRRHGSFVYRVNNVPTCPSLEHSLSLYKELEHAVLSHSRPQVQTWQLKEAEVPQENKYVTAKFFLSAGVDLYQVEEIVKEIANSHSTDKLDLVVLHVDNNGQDPMFLETALSLWSHFEDLSEQGLIENLGVSGLENKDSLAKFLSMVSTLPSVVQVSRPKGNTLSRASCQSDCNEFCALRRYVNEKSLKLTLTSDKPTSFTETEHFGTHFSNTVLKEGSFQSATFKPDWAVRHQSTALDRSILLNTSYILNIKFSLQ